jgi:hypothetical protein
MGREPEQVLAIERRPTRFFRCRSAFGRVLGVTEMPADGLYYASRDAR